LIRYSSKAIPVLAWTDPDGSRRTTLTDFKKIVTPYAPAAFTPRKYSWHSFLLKPGLPPGPWCYRRDYVKEKFQ